MFTLLLYNRESFSGSVDIVTFVELFSCQEKQGHEHAESLAMKKMILFSPFLLLENYARIL